MVRARSWEGDRETISLSESSDSSDEEDEDVVEEQKSENIEVCDEPRQSQEEVKKYSALRKEKTLKK